MRTGATLWCRNEDVKWCERSTRWKIQNILLWWTLQWVLEVNRSCRLPRLPCSVTNVIFPCSNTNILSRLCFTAFLLPSSLRWLIRIKYLKHRKIGETFLQSLWLKILSHADTSRDIHWIRDDTLLRICFPFSSYLFSTTQFTFSDSKRMSLFI